MTEEVPGSDAAGLMELSAAPALNMHLGVGRPGTSDFVSTESSGLAVAPPAVAPPIAPPTYIAESFMPPPGTSYMHNPIPPHATMASAAQSTPSYMLNPMTEPTLNPAGGPVHVLPANVQVVPNNKPKQAKQPKPSKKPVPPKSAYLCFAQERRDQLLKLAEERGEMDDVVKLHGDLSRAIGRQWKALSAEDKKKWSQVSEADQQRYLEECRAAGIEPKLYPHIAGQVRIARPDRIANGECENLVDPLLMGVGRPSDALDKARWQRAHASGMSGLDLDTPLVVQAVLENDDRPRARGKRPRDDEEGETSAGKPPLRWCARTRSFI